LRATPKAAILKPLRHTITIQIVAQFSSSLSRYTQPQSGPLPHPASADIHMFAAQPRCSQQNRPTVRHCHLLLKPQNETPGSLSATEPQKSIGQRQGLQIIC
jgi:hypothetical protein